MKKKLGIWGFLSPLIESQTGRIMRLTFLFLLAGLLQVTASSFGQNTKLNLNVQNVAVREVMQAIENQSKYRFAYSSEFIDLDRKVDLSLKDQSIDYTLKALFEGSGITYEVSDRLIMLYGKTNILNAQQQRTVTGIVTDSSGEPLPGVTVLIKGTTQGTITDFDGNYTISNVSDAATLVFSFVGMRSQEIVVGNQSTINVVMAEDAIGIEEVVAVGYGTMKKVNLVGAVSNIKIEDFSTRPYSDVTNVLQGVMPGLNIKLSSSGADPTTAQQINVRGFNSINGGEPLVLVDGIETEISNINPNDIESVSVLKDAQSAAIYGARGAFGVVLITTKKGTPGEFKIQYSNNFSFSTNTTRTDFVTDPYIFGQTIETAISRWNNSSYFPGYTDEDWDILRKVGNGETEPYYEKKSDGTYRFYEQTDFYNLMYREWRPSQMHNFTVNGGSERLFSYFSGRIMDIATVQNLPKTSLKRYNLNLQLVFKPYDWIEIGGGSKYSQKTDKKYGGGNTGWVDPLDSFWIFHDLYPNYPAEIDGIGVDVGRSGNGSRALLAPQFDGANTWRQWEINNYINDLRVKITPVDNLELNFNYSYDNKFTNQAYRDAPFEYLKTNRLELTTGGLNRYGEWTIKDLRKTLNVFGTYAQSLKKHNFKLMLGYNQEQFRRNQIGAQVENIPSIEKANLGLGDRMYNIDGSTLDWDIKGNFGRFNYDYDDKYLLEVNARLDGSSRFPSENQWGFFPSIGVGWKVSRENFWNQDNIFSDMKIRTSYGSLGNQDVPINTFLQLVNIGQSNWLAEGNVTNYARVPSPLPGNIGWETVNSTNIGLDLGFFNNKLMFFIDWYQRVTKDMYLPGEPLPAVFGASEPKRNYATLRNRGGELSLTYNNSFKLLGSQLSLKINANISNFKGVITKYDNPSGLLSTFWEGQVLGEIWGYHIDGQFQTDEEAAAYQSKFEDDLVNNLGRVYSNTFIYTNNSDWKRLRAGDIKYVDSNQDGKIDNGKNTLDDPGDMSIIGNLMPQFPFGFSANVGWKRFDVSIVGQGIGKQDWYPRGPMFWAFYHRPYQSFIRKDLLDQVWDPEAADNSNNIYPQVLGYKAYHSGNRELYNFNDYYLTNIGYLRVRNLTVGYNIPTEILKKVGVRGLRVFFSGENLFTFTFGGLTKYIDPEAAGLNIDYSDPNLATGTNPNDTEPYPVSKTYSFGLVLDL